MIPSWRMRLAKLILTYRDRRYMAKVIEPAHARMRTERRMTRLYPMRPEMRQQWGTLRHGDRTLEALWVSGPKVARRSVFLYLHGGAYVMGSPLTHRQLAGRISYLTGLRAVMPRYRLAPENPFPAAIDDVTDAYLALLEAGYKPRRIGLGGDSAGGGLALALLHRLRGMGVPRPAASVIFSPWVDMTLASPSVRENRASEAMLPGERIEEIRAMVLGTDGDPMHPEASPLFGKFRGAGPIYIQASDSELLRDDTIRFAAHAARQGVEVTRDLWHNVPHALPLMENRIPEAGEVLYRASDHLRAHVRGATGLPRFDRRRRSGVWMGGEAVPPIS